ncbi:AAA family ATPase [Moraxella bovis]|uniref:Recombination protein F n=1 Tax=Moraxella bovis TaxID=476 RepID=A0A378PQ11_MORBO|nr:AAA family ATPase [Moraxella bovis]STY90656.1 recombination protein F [Moraxella bovis]
MSNEQDYAFKRIEISGYKSIQDVVIEDIPPLMVLAGSNGAGKSNFVDALRLLSELLTQNFEFSNNNLKEQAEHFNVRIIVKNNNLEYLISIADNAIDAEHLEYADQNNNIITYPEFIWNKRLGEMDEKNSEFLNTQNQIDELLKSSNTQDLISAWQKINETLDEINHFRSYMEQMKDMESKNISFTQIHSKELRENKDIDNFLSILSNISIFRIDPLQAKKPSIDNGGNLKTDGSNVASILANLESDDEFRETILDWLSLIVPEMRSIKTDNRHIDGSKMLEFSEDSGKKFPAHLVSDGTIYALCILVAILTRTKKAGITIIEEPERGLHPKAIGELIGFMREYASISHPVILTTHSESIVRELELTELFFVSKENGKTKIKSVKDSGVDKTQIPLDTAWLTNLLNGGLPW